MASSMVYPDRKVMAMGMADEAVKAQLFRLVDVLGSFVPARQFRWVRGESQIVSYRLPGPRPFATAYCRRCGGDVPRIARSLVVVPPDGPSGSPESPGGSER